MHKDKNVLWKMVNLCWRQVHGIGTKRTGSPYYKTYELPYRDSVKASCIFFPICNIHYNCVIKDLSAFQWSNPEYWESCLVSEVQPYKSISFDVKMKKKPTNSKICKNLFSIAFSYLSSDCTVSDYHCLPQSYMACISE